jgi:hypothetical protein
MDSFPPSLELDFQPPLTGVFSPPAQKNPTATANPKSSKRFYDEENKKSKATA